MGTPMRLPPEIFPEIVSGVKGDIAALKALSYTNRMLYYETAPILFHTIKASGGRDKTLNKLYGLSTGYCLARKYVRAFVIRKSATLPNVHDGIKRNGPMGLKQLSVEFMNALISFFQATSEHLETLEVNYSDEDGFAAWDFLVPGQLDALVIALGCQPLSSLTHLRINNLKPQYFRKLRFQSADACHLSRLGASKQVFQKQKAKSNRSKISKLEISYIGRCGDGYDGALASAPKGAIIEFAANYSFGVKEFSLVGGDPTHYSSPRILEPLQLLKNIPLVSLSLTRLYSSGLESVMTECKQLEVISLVDMNVPLYGKRWDVILTAASENLSNLKSLHTFLLTFHHASCRLSATVALRTFNAGDVGALKRLCQQILARGGTVTQGPDKEHIEDPDVDLVICLQKREALGGFCSPISPVSAKAF